LLELRAQSLAQQALGEAGLDACQLVGLLNDLEVEELVVRRRDPSDRRRHVVEISDLRRSRLQQTDRAMAPIDDGLMSRLTPAQRSEFVSLLRFVVGRGASDGDAAPDAWTCPNS
jgi:DNA-binding MarR family transcriptional regulator